MSMGFTTHKHLDLCVDDEDPSQLVIRPGWDAPHVRCFPRVFCAWPCLIRQVGMTLGSPCDCILTGITIANPRSRHDAKPVVDHQQRLNPKMKDAVRTEVLKLLAAGIIYPIADSKWVSPVHCVPKKGGMAVVPNDKNELIPQRTIIGYIMRIDFRKLNKSTRKDHYPRPFIDQMLERLSKNTHFCYIDEYSGFSQIHVNTADQKKTTFTCPYSTYAYRRMPFGLCNAP